MRTTTATTTAAAAAVALLLFVAAAPLSADARRVRDDEPCELNTGDKSEGVKKCRVSSHGSYCTLACSCFGPEAGYPQASLSCDTTLAPSFFYGLVEASNMTVNYAFRNGAFDDFVNFTSTDAEIGPFALPNNGGGTDVSMFYNVSSPFNGTGPQDQQGGFVSVLLFPCKDTLSQPQAQAKPARPGQGLNEVVISWQVPFNSNLGPTNNIGYDVLLKSENGSFVPIKKNIFGADTTHTIHTLERRCDGYTATIRSHFVTDEMTRGPDCTDTYNPVDFYLRQEPTPPTEPTVDETTLAHDYVSAYWTASLDNGGCPDVQYTASILTDTGSELISQQTSETTTEFNLDKAEQLKKNTKYTLSVVATNAAGDSASATVSFTVPGGSHGAKGLSSGQTAGVVIGVLLIVGLAGGAAYYVMRGRRSQYSSI